MATAQGGISVRIDGLDDLQRKLVGSRADAPVKRFLDRGAFMIQGSARKKAPVGVSGRLRNSIGVESPSMRSRRIGPNVDYAEPVEKGSKPHLPPAGALDAWARRKKMDPERLRWSIAKKGTKAHPFMQPAADEAETGLVPLVSALAAELESAYQ